MAAKKFLRGGMRRCSQREREREIGGAAKHQSDGNHGCRYLVDRQHGLLLTHSRLLLKHCVVEETKRAFIWFVRDEERWLEALKNNTTN